VAHLTSFARALAALVGVLLVLGLAGAVYESAAEAATLPTGQLIDVGGHRLYLNCVGSGTPTVVIDAGWGDSSEAWSTSVQPAAATHTRVCTYDRAGMGASEPGPLPRTAERMADELHTLLQRAEVPGPYVLVGHSMGGLPVRVFADRFPAEVVGLVLLDSMNQPGAATTQAPETAADPSGDWLLTLPARVGALRLLGGPAVTPRSMQAWLDEGRGLPYSLAQAHAIKSFGALPLLVLSRSQHEGHDLQWQSEQTELLGLSSNSQQRFAENSGHNIELDQPEAAVAAIVSVLEQVRSAP
jgi:pimeloyl-ACP methyl ester carboxylesterase